MIISAYTYTRFERRLDVSWLFDLAVSKVCSLAYASFVIKAYQFFCNPLFPVWKIHVEKLRLEKRYINHF